MKSNKTVMTAQARAVLAQQQRAAIAARVATAASAVKVSSQLENVRRLRLQLTRFGPPWVLPLIVGSVAAFGASLMAMWIGSPSAVVLLILIALGYLCVGGLAFAVARDAPGEVDENRVARRRELHIEAVAGKGEAEARHAAALAELAAADTALAAAQVAATSKRNALLAIEAGRMYPDELERFVGAIFEHLDFRVRLTGKSGDQGVDVLAERVGLRVAIQVKCYSSSVGNSAVQEAFAGQAHYQCDRCVVVTNNYFTAAAKSLAASTGCLLIDRDLIPQLICGEII